MKELEATDIIAWTGTVPHTATPTAPANMNNGDSNYLYTVLDVIFSPQASE